MILAGQCFFRLYGDPLRDGLTRPPHRTAAPSFGSGAPLSSGAGLAASARFRRRSVIRVVRTKVTSKRLAVYLGLALAAYLLMIKVVVPRLPLPSQMANMKKVEAHIAAIEPGWREFKRDHSGLELVRFWADTRYDGAFGVRGYVTSEVQAAQVISFVRDTHLPRPLYTNQLKMVDPESFAFYKEIESEPAGAAGQSQPVRAETNQPSAAAGSGR